LKKKKKLNTLAFDNEQGGNTGFMFLKCSTILGRTPKVKRLKAL
jgi:hypothetical protein